MNIAVIGGAGFIGSTLVDKLLLLGNQVVVIDDLSTGKKEYLNPEAEFIEFDITKSVDTLAEFLSVHKVQIVFHLAAWARVVRSVEDPLGTHNVNVNGTVNLLEAMRKARVNHLVFSSSSSVYGDQESHSMSETMIPNPKSPYALHKQIGEEYISLYAKLFGLRAISLRYFNVYGLRQVTEGETALVIGKFLSKKALGQKVSIYGNGDQTRDYTNVSDVVEANIKAMDYFFDRPAITEAKNEIINIGTHAETNINQIAALIGVEAENIIPNPRGQFEEEKKVAIIYKAEELLGWQPKISIEEGIKELL